MTTVAVGRIARTAATAALVGGLLLTPASALAIAGGNPPTAECSGFAYYLKIDNIGDGGIEAGAYALAGAHVETNWDGQTVTISNVGDGGQAFDWASTKVVAKVVAKEGAEEFASTTGLPGTTGSVSSTIKQGLSHVTFCGEAEPVATQTPEPEVTATPEPEATATPQPDVTATPDPQGSSTPEPAVTSTPEPRGTVGGATGKPRMTLPATDSTVERSASTGSAWPLVLLALAGLALGATLLRPATRRATR